MRDGDLPRKPFAHQGALLPVARQMRHHGPMHARLLLLGSLILPPSVALAAEPPPASNVRIYRCVASDGTVALQSTPCDDTHRQQVLDMQRPQDPSPRPATPPQPQPAPAAATNEREVRIVTVQPPQPMYECVGPDGERYLSDDGIGNPRWVPLWVGGHYPPPRGSGGSVSGNLSLGSGQLSIRGGQPPGHGHPHPRPDPVVAGGTWIRDSCHPLPQQEVCDRLRDRRWELIRRYNSALQSERQELKREQRGIEARLGRDCGG